MKQNENNLTLNFMVGKSFTITKYVHQISMDFLVIAITIHIYWFLMRPRPPVNPKCSLHSNPQLHVSQSWQPARYIMQMPTRLFVICSIQNRHSVKKSLCEKKEKENMFMVMSVGREKWLLWETNCSLIGWHGTGSRSCSCAGPGQRWTPRSKHCLWKPLLAKVVFTRVSIGEGGSTYSSE